MQDEENAKTPPQSQPKVRALGVLRDRFTSKDPNDKREIARGEITFTIDATACAPGAFDTDFEVTMRSTRAVDEINLAKQYRNNPVAYSFALARACLWKVDGETVPTEMESVLWEALGPGGRNLVLIGWQQLTTPTEQSLEKTAGTLKIGG